MYYTNKIISGCAYKIVLHLRTFKMGQNIIKRYKYVFIIYNIIMNEEKIKEILEKQNNATSLKDSGNMMLAQ
jgi:hypothetical protein